VCLWGGGHGLGRSRSCCVQRCQACHGNIMCRHRKCIQPYIRTVERGNQSTDTASKNCSRISPLRCHCQPRCHLGGHFVACSSAKAPTTTVLTPTVVPSFHSNHSHPPRLLCVVVPRDIQRPGLSGQPGSYLQRLPIRHHKLRARSSSSD
jgi:hypothetical protein